MRTVKKNKKNSDTASMSRGTRRRFSSIQNKGVMIYYNLEAKIFKIFCNEIRVTPSNL